LTVFKAKVGRKLQDLHTVLFIDDLNEILFDGFIGLLADEVFVCLNKIGDEFRAELAAEYYFIFDYGKVDDSESVYIAKLRKMNGNLLIW
jgi:hypothetical protein